MAGKLEQLKNNLEAALGSRIVSLTQALGEITVVVAATDYLAAAQTLHDDPRLAFAQLMDLCGVDYSAYGDGIWKGPRFASTSQRPTRPSAACLCHCGHRTHLSGDVHQTGSSPPLSISMKALLHLRIRTSR